MVYGDIGTSPLYALRETFIGEPVLAVTPEAVLGVLSLIFWSLVLVISVKYLTVVMRADDQGEGGVLVLQTLATRGSQRGARTRALLVLLGLFGTALLYGDGMITPAISVLSAVEGLGVATSALEPVVVPVAVAVLVLLFLPQRFGTGRIGAVFGPVMLLWFGSLALTGALRIVARPEVLWALSPTHAVAFLATGGAPAFVSLGSIFLVVTGSEALYADMGHFGRRPIALGWAALVMPALTLQYFGQGALLLADPGAVDAVFYRMVPGWLLLPLVALATLATVIASQALISGVFSLTMQAVQFDFLPRLAVEHTSDRRFGQVYVPVVNWGLLTTCVGLVVGFGDSGDLAAAYGVAVVLTMVITTLLFAVVARDRLGWSAGVTGLVCVAFLVVDVGFLAANAFKIPDGGWFPILVGGSLLAVMSTWRRGRELVARALRAGELRVEQFLGSLSEDPPPRVPGTAVYLFGRPRRVPPALLTNLERNHVLHEQILLVAVVTEPHAHVPAVRRADLDELGGGFHQVVLHYGFADEVDVPRALAEVVEEGFGFVPEEAGYVLGGEMVLPRPGTGMAAWREHLFALMHRNAGRASRHFRLPPERVVEIGRQVEI